MYYRCAKNEDGSYFTVNRANRHSDLLVRHVGRPRAVIERLEVTMNANVLGFLRQPNLPDFNVQLGALSSALEHAIPEQMFATPEQPGEAVSAVKALQKAAQQGQRIYHITQANMATALPMLHHDSHTVGEIRQALNAGREVITHTDPITVPGWKGAGYVLMDQETGAAAWKIGGGLNGGVLPDQSDMLKDLWNNLLLPIFEEIGPTAVQLFGKVKSAIDNTILLIKAIVAGCSLVTIFAAIVSITMLTVGSGAIAGGLAEAGCVPCSLGVVVGMVFVIEKVTTGFAKKCGVV